MYLYVQNFSRHRKPKSAKTSTVFSPSIAIFEILERIGCLTGQVFSDIKNSYRNGICLSRKITLIEKDVKVVSVIKRVGV